MVKIHHQPKVDSGTIVAQPNRSLNWRQSNRFLVIVVGIYSLFSAIGLYFGLWPILFYSILGAIVLWAVFYLVQRRNTLRLVIRYDQNHINIEQGHRYPERCWHYDRHWAKCIVKRAKTPSRKQIVLIRSHGKQLELGHFLNEKDQDALVGAIGAIIPVRKVAIT